MNWKALSFLLIFFFVCVSCGSSSTTVPQQMKSLQVMRDTGTLNHYPPLERTITNVKAIQSLYKASLALPKVSTTGGAHSCPAAYDLVYHLSFYDNSSLVERMDMNPSGCPFILVKKNDMRSVTTSFLSLFAQITGIPQSQIDIQPIHQTTKPPHH